MNVTAIILGDPSAAQRRAPTPAERARTIAQEAYHKAVDHKRPRTAGTFYIGPRGKLLGRMDVDDFIEVVGLSQTRNYARWFAERDMAATFKKIDETTWRLTRIK